MLGKPVSGYFLRVCPVDCISLGNTYRPFLDVSESPVHIYGNTNHKKTVWPCYKSDVRNACTHSVRTLIKLNLLRHRGT